MNLVMNHKPSSLSKNYIYNLIYQILVVIIPIILIPYLSRVLEPSGTGLYAFNYTIVTYLSYFALLGVQLYGTKAIATKKENEKDLRKTFFEILTLKAITSFISISLLILIVLMIEVLKSMGGSTFSLSPLLSPEILMIQGLFLLANLLDITFLYTGLENFKGIVIRNSVIKITTLILIFIFVKEKSDLWIYALIINGGEVISQSILWMDRKRIPLFKDLNEVKIDFKPFRHLKDMVILFIPQVIILLYTSLNVTMIGLLSTDIQVGFFDMSSRIINTVLVIATALGTVMLPRISKYHHEGKHEEIKSILDKSLHTTTYLAYPLMVGLFILSTIFVPWFFGPLYVDATNVLKFYAIKIGLVTLSNVIGIQYMISTNKYKPFIISVSIGAIITLGLNIFLIPIYGALGAVIASLIAEGFVTLYQIISTRKEIPFMKYILNTYKTFISAIMMGLILYVVDLSFYSDFVQLLSPRLSEDIYTLLILGFYGGIGVIIYLILNLFLKTSIQEDMMNRFIKIFKK